MRQYFLASVTAILHSNCSPAYPRDLTHGRTITPVTAATLR